MRVGATVAQLNTPAPPAVVGVLGLLRVGTWPDVEIVRLVWDGTRWVGKPMRGLMTMLDGQFMQTSMRGYGYLTSTPGGPPYGWCCIRSVRNAKKLYAAGLHLQDRMTARCSTNGSTLRVAAGYFSYDDGTVLSFTNDHPVTEHPVVPYVECATTQAQTWSSSGNPTTLNVDSTAGFAAGGSAVTSHITVEGIALFYSGLTATSFTGLALSASVGANTQKLGSFASGAVVRQATAVDFPMSPEGHGKGTDLVSDPAVGLYMYDTSWKDIVLQVLNRNGEPQKPVVVMDPANLKTDLYITPYATSSSGGAASVAALDYSMRWVG